MTLDDVFVSFACFLLVFSLRVSCFCILIFKLPMPAQVVGEECILFSTETIATTSRSACGVRLSQSPERKKKGVAKKDITDEVYKLPEKS